MQDGLVAFHRGEHKAARSHFRTLANRGNPAAETLLGTMSANGQGGPKDDAVAAAWFLRAARRGYAPAQMALADSFARGRGVPKDLNRAKGLARAAAVQGQPGAAQLVARVTPERYALLQTQP
jgi:TPR repeat protein